MGRSGNFEERLIIMSETIDVIGNVRRAIAYLLEQVELSDEYKLQLQNSLASLDSNASDFIESA